MAVEVGAILETRSVGGGCISNACRVESTNGPFFLKWSTGEAGGTFEAESDGLRLLRSADSPLRMPAVLSAENSRDGSAGHILLEWIEEGPKPTHFFDGLGAGLAQLHRSVSTKFGFDSPNFIGRLPQINTKDDDWADFFLACRLEPQAELARQGGRWRNNWEDHFARLEKEISSILPAKPPASTVHGDLWAGNVIADSNGSPVLIDPAAHYGHREVDLGMTELFGGFPAVFYTSYGHAWPLQPGYETRREVYNLYHLINHLNHFGSGYAGQVNRILKRF